MRLAIPDIQSMPSCVRHSAVPQNIPDVMVSSRVSERASASATSDCTVDRIVWRIDSSVDAGDEASGRGRFDGGGIVPDEVDDEIPDEVDDEIPDEVDDDEIPGISGVASGGMLDGGVAIEDVKGIVNGSTTAFPPDNDGGEELGVTMSTSMPGARKMPSLIVVYPWYSSSTYEQQLRAEQQQNLKS